MKIEGVRGQSLQYIIIIKDTSKVPNKQHSNNLDIPFLVFIFVNVMLPKCPTLSICFQNVCTRAVHVQYSIADHIRVAGHI